MKKETTLIRRQEVLQGQKEFQTDRDPLKLFMNLISLNYDFGDIEDIDYDTQPLKKIFVRSSDNEYVICLWDVIQNHTKGTWKIEFSVYKELK